MNQRKFFYYCLNSYSGRLLSINCIVFLIICAYDQSIFTPSQDTLITMGAIDPISLAKGQWWRLLSANFIHYGLLHIVFNSLALYVIGQYIEKIIGGILFLFIYILSGITAILATTLVNLSLGMGASGAIFGLVGVGCVIEHLFLRKAPDDFFPKFKTKYQEFINKRPFAFIAILNILLAFFLNIIASFFKGFNVRIDNTAHLVGLLSGASLFLGVHLIKKNSKKNKRTIFGILILTLNFLVLISGIYFTFKTSYIPNHFIKNAEASKEPYAKYYYYTQALSIRKTDDLTRFKRARVLMFHGEKKQGLNEIKKIINIKSIQIKAKILVRDLRLLNMEKEADELIKLIEMSNDFSERQ